MIDQGNSKAYIKETLRHISIIDQGNTRVYIHENEISRKRQGIYP